LAEDDESTLLSARRRLSNNH